MTLQILAILLPVKMNEIEGTRPNSCSQAFALKSRDEDFKNGFQIF